MGRQGRPSRTHQAIHHGSHRERKIEMNSPETLTVSRHGETEILITRVFEASRHLVFDAHTKPDLLKRWLGVRNGWILAVCEIDLRVGGAFRYVWRNEAKGLDMGAGGIYREIIP